MFKALFSSIERTAIVALLAALAYATYQLVTIENDLTEANKAIKTKSLEIDNLTMQTDFLAQSVELTEKQNQKLIRERESLSRINQAYQDEVSQLTNSLKTSQSEIEVPLFPAVNLPRNCCMSLILIFLTFPTAF